MSNFEELKTEVDRLTRIVELNHPQDPSIISTKTQNIYTLFAIIVALVGIPGAIGFWNISEFRKDQRFLTSEIEALKSEIRDRQTEFEKDIEEDLTQHMNRRFEEFNTARSSVNELLDKRFEVLRERVLDSIGEEAGERQLSLSSKVSNYPVVVEIGDNETDPPYCGMPLTIVVTNQTNLLTEMVSDSIHTTSPISYSAPEAVRDGYFDSQFDSFTQWSGRFVPGYTTRNIFQDIYVSIEHAAAVLERHRAGQSFGVLYEINYKSGSNHTKTVSLETEVKLTEEFVDCLEQIEDFSFELEHLNSNEFTGPGD